MLGIRLGIRLGILKFSELDVFILNQIINRLIQHPPAQTMFRPGTKKYRNPYSVRLCGFFVVRRTQRGSYKSSHKSSLYSHIGFVTPVWVLLLGECAVSKDKLTDSKLRTAKPETKEYRLGDGDGLYLPAV